jgi:hypothetical protein
MENILFMDSTIGQAKWVAAGRNVAVLDRWPTGPNVDPSVRILPCARPGGLAAILLVGALRAGVAQEGR